MHDMLEEFGRCSSRIGLYYRLRCVVGGVLYIYIYIYKRRSVNLDSLQALAGLRVLYVRLLSRLWTVSRRGAIGLMRGRIQYPTGLPGPLVVSQETQMVRLFCSSFDIKHSSIGAVWSFVVYICGVLVRAIVWLVRRGVSRPRPEE